jgi:hypothetical protein
VDVGSIPTVSTARPSIEPTQRELSGRLRVSALDEGFKGKERPGDLPSGATQGCRICMERTPDGNLLRGVDEVNGAWQMEASGQSIGGSCSSYEGKLLGTAS